MVILLGSLQLGILYGMLALGIYITFRIMNVPDLTAEGSFTLGLALSAVLTIQGHPLLGLAAALLAGAAARHGHRTAAYETGDSSYFIRYFDNERSLFGQSIGNGKQFQSIIN